MINFDETNKQFHISTDSMSYIMQIEANGELRNLYWGSAIDSTDAGHVAGLISQSSFDKDVRSERQEYNGWNGHNFTLPCLRAERGKNRSVFLEYAYHEITQTEDSSLLIVTFEDREMGLIVNLEYKLYEEYDILERKTKIQATKDLTLTSLMSASVTLPFRQDTKARYLQGKWADECQMTETDIDFGILSLQSRRGISGPHLNPSIALGEPGADEYNGTIWYALLAYSGNWVINVEKTSFENTHITAGINDFDFELSLASGETADTPSLFVGLSTDGFGGMSRKLHRFIRYTVLPSDAIRPVLYNSWEATFFDVSVKEQMNLANKAAQIGCELFVIDDGWFGERHSDHAGLGDWSVNKQKFPNGLNELINHVKNLGMQFGIWIEPEAVNPDSELYRAHPDWIYRYPDHEPILLRNQYVLNLSLNEVQAYLREQFFALLDNHDIDFIKWDMNRVVTDMYSIPDGKSKSLWHEHVNSVYSLWADFRNRYPDLQMETCSGGGGRMDLGMFRFADQAWPSDNTDPYARLSIQHGYSYFYPASTMVSWVTESPSGKQFAQRPLSYRFHSAMCGTLGIGANILHFDGAELDECKHWIEKYKTWRHIIQQGTLFRLMAPGRSNYTVIQYLSEDERESIVFIFVDGVTAHKIGPMVKLQGLQLDAMYSVEIVNSATEITDTSGSTLMRAGLYCPLNGDYTSEVVYLRRV